MTMTETMIRTIHDAGGANRFVAETLDGLHLEFVGALTGDAGQMTQMIMSFVRTKLKRNLRPAMRTRWWSGARIRCICGPTASAASMASC